MVKKDDSKLDKFEQEQVVVKRPTEINFDVAFKDEQIVSNGTVEKAVKVGSEDSSGSFTSTRIEVFFDEFGNLITTTNTTSDIKKADGLRLDDLHNVFVENGNSASVAYAHLKNYIIENKDNDEAIQNTISMLLGDLGMAYDHNKAHRKVGIDQVDVLDKILSTDKGEEVPALICGTIHDFAAQMLEDCGINACLLTGGQLPDGGPHATLLYQRSDGKYVFNNYSKSMLIDAPSMKDAAREVYKRSGSLESSGMISFKDKDNSSYQEFAFRDEAAFGKEIDKKDYNSVSPFEGSVAKRPSVDGNVVLGSKGSVSATVGGTLAYGNNDKAYETSVDVEYKRNGETSMFLKSQSLGLKAEQKFENDKNGLFYNVKGVVDLTEGQVGGIKYNSFTNPDDSVDGGKVSTNTYLTAMIRGDVGKKTTLVEDDNLKLTNVGKATVHALGTTGLGDIKDAGSIDGRITIEEGMRLQNTVGNVGLDNNLSAGGVVDFTHTCDGAKPALGLKLNASSGVKFSPNENLTIGAGVKGYSVFTKSSTENGLQGGVQAQYKPEGSKVTVFGSANVGVERQDLSLGLFNEKTESNMMINTTLGAQLSKNTTIQVGYTRYNDKLNKTRNYNEFKVGVNYTF